MLRAEARRAEKNVTDNKAKDCMAFVAYSKLVMAPMEMASTVSSRAFVISDTVARMMRDVSIATRWAVVSDIGICTSGKETRKATTNGELVVRVSRGKSRLR